jgi:predicted lipoprotein with Yx(FWY)xxD motif
MTDASRMTYTRTALRGVLLVVPLTAMAIAGCGGGGSSQAASAPNAGGRATVEVTGNPLGKILVDSHGRTLYLFEKDTGGKSTCSGACASAWPPFTTDGKPVARAGAAGSRLATTTRAGGAREVTYGGHPLYYYAGDEAAGETNGQGLAQFGAEWYVVSPAGKAITSSALGPASGGGGGY